MVSIETSIRLSVELQRTFELSLLKALFLKSESRPLLDNLRASSPALSLPDQKFTIFKVLDHKAGLGQFREVFLRRKDPSF